VASERILLVLVATISVTYGVEAVVVVVVEVNPVATFEHAAEIFFAGQLAMNEGVGTPDRFWKAKVVDNTVTDSTAVAWTVKVAGASIAVPTTADGE